MTTKSVLISIRSLMNENPFFNEPGYESKEKSYEVESNSYNERVTHDTLRVAVIEMVSSALEPAVEGSSDASASNGIDSSDSADSFGPIPSMFTSAPNGPVSSSIQKRYGRAMKTPFNMPQVLKELVIRLFYKKYSFYVSLIEKNVALDGVAPTYRSNFFLEKGQYICRLFPVQQPFPD